MTSLFTRGLAVTLFLMLLAAPAVFAQETVPPQQPPQVEIDFTEDELDAFAEAYLDIESLQARYQSELDAVEDPTEAQSIQERFQVDVMQTIDQHDIAAERYDEIILATQADPEFAQSVLERIEEARP